MEYVIHLRYIDGKKGKATVHDALSAQAAISLVMAEIPQVVVAFCSVN